MPDYSCDLFADFPLMWVGVGMLPLGKLKPKYMLKTIEIQSSSWHELMSLWHVPATRWGFYKENYSWGWLFSVSLQMRVFHWYPPAQHLQFVWIYNLIQNWAFHLLLKNVVMKLYGGNDALTWVGNISHSREQLESPQVFTVDGVVCSSLGR